MRRKIVLWGSDQKDEKILVALELKDEANKVNIYTFEEKIATEELYNNLMDDWRNGKEIEFPEGFKKLERSLSVTDGLLPEDIKVERTDVITRAQAEWHFVVLSDKLYKLFKSELEKFEEKVGSLHKYEQSIWDEMREFWAKVQGHVHEKTLFREHASELKTKTNSLFDKLKELRKSLQSELKEKSTEVKKEFVEAIDIIEEKIDKGLGLGPLFNELKEIQNKFKKADLLRNDKNSVWNKIDKAFKNLKNKRFGDSSQASSSSKLDRISNRYNGLLNAIRKMENSIAADERDLNYQGKRMSETDGQLEQQIRQAKIKMIEERIKSKKEKLEDMLKTKAELENKIEKEKQRQEKLKEEKAKEEKINKAKEEVKQKIAEEIKDQGQLSNEEKEKLAKAAEEINKRKGGKKPTILEAAGNVISESVEDIVDTVKAVAEVVEDKIEEVISELKEEE